ncbi:hypothetical protein [Xanthomonas sacchari]|uniref:hypothetical protein n=1 Tax=Xanthomonas sacchari TaxID=56458 RepID=UPI003B21A755
MQDNDATVIHRLHTLAGQGRETIEVYEGGSTIPVIVLLWVISFFMTVPALMMLAFAFRQTWWMGGAGLAIGIGLFLLGRRFWKRRTTPFLCLSEAGLQYLDLTRPIPWTSVQGYRVGAGQLAGENLILFVDLRDGCEVPLKDSGLTSAAHSVRRVWYNPKEHWIVFKTLGVRGMSCAHLIELFETYLEAGRARAQLAPLERPGTH